MKTRCFVGWFGLLALSGSVIQAASLGTAFTYQGQLSDGATATTGLYDFTFTLWNSSAGGSQLGPTLAPTSVPVTNGLFTIVLDFGNAFDGNARWLGISVKTNGGASFSALSPRQNLSPSPYAVYSPNAGAASTAVTATTAYSATIANGVINGQVVKSLNGLKDDVMLSPGANISLIPGGQTLGIASPTDWHLTGNSVTTPGVNFIGTTDAKELVFKVESKIGLRLMPTQYPSLVGGDPNNYVDLQGHYDFIGGGLGNAIYSNTWHAAIGGGAYNLVSKLATDWFPDNAVISGGSYNTNAGTDAVVPGGVYNYAHGRYSFAAGFSAKSLHESAFVWADNLGSPFASTGPRQFLIRAAGGVGIGKNDPAMALDVSGAAGAIDLITDVASTNNGSFTGGLRLGGLYSGEGVSSKRTAGGNQYGIDFYTGFAPRMSISQAGDVRINSSQLFLHSGEDRNHGLSFRSTVNGILLDGPYIYGFNGGGLGVSNPDTVTLKWDWSGNVWISNRISVASIETRGGGDVAESFPVSEQDVAPGTVMVIDELNPGQLQPSSIAYDTRVAGIVSGAGGVNPGLELQQEGVLGQGQKIALTGRVYALADASTESIKPGDLLTTSPVRGRAMKATDRDRAQGAILGKAMTGLKEGKGLVLVLVTLQ